MQERQDYRQLYLSMLEAFNSVHLAYFLIELIYDQNDKAVDFRYLEINSAVETLFGKKREEIVGKTRNELFGEQKVESDIILKTCEIIAKTGKPAHFESYDSALQKYYDTYAWKMDERLVVISMDITERKRIEDALKSQATILDIVNDAVVASDSNFVITSWNRCAEKIYGWSAKEAIGKQADELFKTEFITENAFWAFQQLISKGYVHQEVIHSRKDGSKLIVDAMVSAIKDSNGKIIRTVASFRDITERKHAEEALKQRTQQLEQSQQKLEKNAEQLEAYATQMEQLAEQRAKKLQEQERLATIGQTAGMVGHDIRNPLQAIVSEIYLVKDSLTNLESTEKREVLASLDFMQEQIDYISKIVADLQDYARETKPNLTEVKIEELVNTAFSVLAVPKNIEVNCEIEPDIEISSDPAYLRRIITNLSTNAIQAMPEGGKLTIAANRLGDFVEITVKDTGVGMPENVKEKLFKPLFTTKARGQGFGLAVVKKFIDQLGGAITYDSQQGKGTIFIIRLPKKQK
ncbi:MAG TPA: ATP-binding protein [Candidatus Acidoferrales bacterium]|nr:ATP-binding protein [Candidatus Acidoferrales bacterium]